MAPRASSPTAFLNHGQHQIRRQTRSPKCAPNTSQSQCDHAPARSAAKPDPNDVRALISAIDKAAKRGIIHRNAAQRRKSRLNKMLAVAGKK